MRASILPLLLIIGWATPMQSQSGLVQNGVFEIVNQGFSHHELIDSVQVLIDPEGQLSFNDIQSPPYRDQFRSLAKTGNSFGINKNNYWFRVNIQFTDSAKGI